MDDFEKQSSLRKVQSLYGIGSLKNKPSLHLRGWPQGDKLFVSLWPLRRSSLKTEYSSFLSSSENFFWVWEKGGGMCDSFFFAEAVPSAPPQEEEARASRPEPRIRIPSPVTAPPGPRKPLRGSPPEGAILIRWAPEGPRIES